MKDLNMSNISNKIILEANRKFENLNFLKINEKFVYDRKNKNVLDVKKDILGPIEVSVFNKNYSVKFEKGNSYVIGKNILSNFIFNFAKILLKNFHTFKFRKNLFLLFKKIRMIKSIFKLFSKKMIRVIYYKILEKIKLIQKFYKMRLFSIKLIHHLILSKKFIRSKRKFFLSIIKNQLKIIIAHRIQNDRKIKKLQNGLFRKSK